MLRLASGLAFGAVIAALQVRRRRRRRAIRNAERVRATDRSAVWCVRLPPEIRLRILAWAVQHAAVAAPGTPAVSFVPLLTLSHACCRALTPVAYHTVRITTPRALHQLRRTLVLLRPDLGAYVHTLALEGLTDALALALEHLLVLLPALTHLALDAPSCTALCRSTAEGLRCGACPTRLSLVLPDSEAALCASGSLFTYPLCAHIHTLYVAASPGAALVLLQRLDSCLDVLRVVHLGVYGSDAGVRRVRDMCVGGLACRNVAVHVTHVTHEVPDTLPLDSIVH
ncbi:hypothetical protein MBRA1_000815 [Malassezia brasiliensis]|uniref:Uncharacterized protein n=1 Tax=Malassezia brasiliensis TaxID=1821822 RepID=A0AAF0DRR5_9BASI|nr:hypothetical protein MBRA1_000815 [Malassezia brasiliensis]